LFGFATGAGCVVFALGVLLVTAMAATGATTAGVLGFTATGTGCARVVIVILIFS